VGVAVLVALVGTGVAVVTLAGRPTRAQPVTPAEANAAARTACSEATTFEELVARNASVDEVTAALRRAEREADTAARGDAAWIALAGGIKALRLSLSANDGRAARTGIDVVRAECRRTAG
jgi:hypothetical protein